MVKQPARISNKIVRASKPLKTTLPPSRAPAPKNGTAAEIRKFTCALDDPFCLESFGAKVPDEYTLPSVASTLRHRFTVTNTAGSQYLVATPHPNLGTLSMSGGGAAAPALTAVSGVAQDMVVNSVATRRCTIRRAYPISGSTMGANNSAYRTVGWGVRIKNITSAANVAGSIIVGVLPTTGHIPTHLANYISDQQLSVFGANVGDQLEELRSYLSLPTRSYSVDDANLTYGTPILSGIDSLASSDTFLGTELAQTGGILIRPRVHSPAVAWKFRPCVHDNLLGNSSVNAGKDVFAFNATTQGGAGAGYIGYNADVMDTSGQNCVVIAFSGSATGQTYEIEVIYHLELVPVLNTDSTIAGYAARASPMAPRPQLDTAIHKVMSAPWVDFVKHEGSRAIGSMIQALPGLMTRAAMVALA